MGERRLVIAIDCDDVMVPTAYKTLNHYGEKYGHAVDPAAFYEGTAEDWGVTELKEASKRIENYFRSNDFRDFAKVPFPEAVVAIPALARVHELHLVTGRADFMEQTTQEMVDEYFPECFQSVVHTNFFKDRFRRTKGQVCREIGAHVLIDDHIVHGHSVIDDGVENAIIFGDYPWNERDYHPEWSMDDKLRPGLVRVSDWNRALLEVDRIAKR
ncbi:MAG: hypothetical protein WAW80_00775 [Candidatus Saccharimonadales bacterium]